MKKNAMESLSDSGKIEKNPKDMPDEELVAVALYDQEFFLHIINRYKTRLFSYIRRISNLSEEDAEDVLQDVFIKVYQNLNDYDETLKFSSWIYRIAHNQVISNFRKLSARPQKAGFDLDSEMVKNISSDLDPAREVDEIILKEGIAQILEKMQQKYKDVLVLKYLEEKSYNEISDIIKKPVGTVGSMLNKAKLEFKKELKALNIEI